MWHYHQLSYRYISTTVGLWFWHLNWISEIGLFDQDTTKGINFLFKSSRSPDIITYFWMFLMVVVIAYRSCLVTDRPYPTVQMVPSWMGRVMTQSIKHAPHDWYRGTNRSTYVLCMVPMEVTGHWWCGPSSYRIPHNRSTPHDDAHMWPVLRFVMFLYFFTSNKARQQGLSKELRIFFRYFVKHRLIYSLRYWECRVETQCYWYCSS